MMRAISKFFETRKARRVQARAAVAYLDARRARRAAESMRRDARALRSEFAANLELSK